MSYYETLREKIPYINPSNILEFLFHEPLKYLKNIDTVTGVSYPLTHYSLHDYLKTIPEKYSLSPKYNQKYHNALLKMAQELVNEGLITPIGEKTGIYQQYMVNGLDGLKLKYGYYDYLIFGFPVIKKEFEEAVRFLEVEYIETGEFKIGTSFSILHDNKQFLVTAKHCLPEDTVIKFKPFLSVTQNTIPENIYYPIDDKVDIAILEFSDKLALSNSFFEIDRPYTLDKVMTVGFPPIQGVADAIQIASTGEITAITKTYWHNEEQILISSRVKGGSSGSPVINKFGYVVGIVTNTLVDPYDIKKPDELGFGLALSSSVLNKLLTSINKKDNNYYEMQVFEEKKGFSVKYFSL